METFWHMSNDGWVSQTRAFHNIHFLFCVFIINCEKLYFPKAWLIYWLEQTFSFSFSSFILTFWIGGMYEKCIGHIKDLFKRKS